MRNYPGPELHRDRTLRRGPCSLLHHRDARADDWIRTSMVRLTRAVPFSVEPRRRQQGQKDSNLRWRFWRPLSSPLDDAPVRGGMGGVEPAASAVTEPHASQYTTYPMRRPGFLTRPTFLSGRRGSRTLKACAQPLSKRFPSPIGLPFRSAVIPGGLEPPLFPTSRGRPGR